MYTKNVNVSPVTCHLSPVKNQKFKLQPFDGIGVEADSLKIHKTKHLYGKLFVYYDNETF